MKRGLVLVLFLTLGALVLRGWQLDSQSLWSDEGLSLYRARQPVAEILSNTITVDGVNTQDTNPPLYFLLLHFWRAIAGESVFALRYFGGLISVLAVPLVYVLATRMLGRQVGFVAAFLVAISPIHVWQSQEMRNYSLLLVWNLISTYGLARFTLHGPGERRTPWLAVWGLAGLAGIYTHYFGFFVFAFGVAYLILSNPKRRWLWIAVAICAVAVFPILLIAVRRFAAGQQIDFVVVPIRHLISHATSVYSVGMQPTVVQPWWRVVPVVALAIFGAVLSLVAGWRGGPDEQVRRRLTAGLLIGYQLIPLGIMAGLSTINPLYNGPRHLLIGLPPFLILVAGGLSLPRGRWRWATAAIGMAVLTSQAQWLVVQFTAPELIKDDLRGAADYLNQMARPDDVIVLHDALIQFVFDYYYDGPAPWCTIPAYGEQDPAEAIRQLEALGEETAGRIWFLAEPRPRSGFPRQILTDWVSQHWVRYLDRRFEWLWLTVSLEGYLPQVMAAGLGADAVPMEVTLGDLRLEGYRAAQQTTAGEFYGITTYWTMHSPQRDDLTISVRLVDPSGTIWQQWDTPVFKYLAPSKWPDGPMVRVELELKPPVGLPPGSYQIWLRVLDGAKGPPRVMETGADSILLIPTLAVEPPEPVHPIVRLGSPVRLVGSGWPEGDYRPGHPLPLELTWTVRRRPAVDFRLRVELVDGAGETVAESISAPTRADYPPTIWEPGQTLRGKMSVTLPPQSTGGSLAVFASLYDPSNGLAIPVQTGWWPFGNRRVKLGEVTVTPWPLETSLPAIEKEFAGWFGDPPVAELAGYDLHQTEEELSLTLYWQAKMVLDQSWVVFVHLTSTSDEIVSQGDGLPAEGSRPTTTWRPGEVIQDPHAVSLQGVPAGIYTLRVGLYSGQERLVATGDDGRWPADEVVLETIEVAR